MKGHVFVAGKTQSGKTYLMKKYLMNTYNVFILATKKVNGRFAYNELPPSNVYEFTTINDFPNDEDLEQYTHFIYIPKADELFEDFYNDFFKKIYNLTIPCTIVIDELMQVCKNTQTYPLYYKYLLTQGTEQEKYVWSLTQRPASIPVLALSESEHYFIFTLNSINDRKKLKDWTGYEDFMLKPKDFSFIYYNSVSDYLNIGKLI